MAAAIAVFEPVVDDLRVGDVCDVVERIWCDLLDLDSVDRDENFFDAGGTSLLLALVHAELARAFPGAAPTMVDLAQSPTVRLTARLIAG